MSRGFLLLNTFFFYPGILTSKSYFIPISRKTGIN